MSQATRRITYASVSNVSGAQTVYSSATTKGELFNEFPDIAILSKGMKPWVKDAANAVDKGYGLSHDDMALPTGDVQLYFLVDKNDSGKR
jgi:hypothetical protein